LALIGGRDLINRVDRIVPHLLSKMRSEREEDILTFSRNMNMPRTRADTENPPPKRRKLNGTTTDSANSQAGDESSDELAAASDYERKDSWAENRQSRSPEVSGSPDERMDAETDAETNAWGRNTRESPAKDENTEQDNQAADTKEESDDMTPAQRDDTSESPEHPEHIPTPEPPPLKADHVHYVQKYLLKGHLRGVSAVKFSPDRTMLASGGMLMSALITRQERILIVVGADGTLKVWDTLTGQLIHTFEGHLAGISTVAWGPDNETIATGSDDKTIRLWNALTGKAHPRAFNGHHNYVYSIAFSPKGNILVSGSYDEAVFLWDVRSAKVMRSLPAHSDPVAGIDVCHDGTLVVSCSSDGLIRVWDTMTGQCLRTLVHEDNPPVMAVRFSPNSKYVLAWTLDDCIRLWDYVQGRCIKTYQGHVNRKYSLCGNFGTYGAPDGPAHAFAVSGSEDGALVCWDVVDKNILQRIEGHADVVLGVDTAEINGRRLIASCGLDKTVRLWEEIQEDVDTDSPETNGEENMDGIVNGTAPPASAPGPVPVPEDQQNGVDKMAVD
jgi:COMPASS component SWD3